MFVASGFHNFIPILLVFAVLIGMLLVGFLEFPDDWSWLMV